MDSRIKKPVKTFNVILIRIANNLTEDQKKDLIFSKELPESQAEKCTADIRDFWKYMQQRPDQYRYSEDDPSELWEDLRCIGLEAVAKTAESMYKQLKDYKAQTQTQTPHSGEPRSSTSAINADTRTPQGAQAKRIPLGARPSPPEKSAYGGAQRTEHLVSLCSPQGSEVERGTAHGFSPTGVMPGQALEYKPDANYQHSGAYPIQPASAQARGLEDSSAAIPAQQLPRSRSAPDANFQHSGAYPIQPASAQACGLKDSTAAIPAQQLPGSRLAPDANYQHSGAYPIQPASAQARGLKDSTAAIPAQQVLRSRSAPDANFQRSGAYPIQPASAQARGLEDSTAAILAQQLPRSRSAPHANYQHSGAYPIQPASAQACGLEDSTAAIPAQQVLRSRSAPNANFQRSGAYPIQPASAQARGLEDSSRNNQSIVNAPLPEIHNLGVIGPVGGKLSPHSEQQSAFPELLALAQMGNADRSVSFEPLPSALYQQFGELRLANAGSSPGSHISVPRSLQSEDHPGNARPKEVEHQQGSQLSLSDIRSPGAQMLQTPSANPSRKTSTNLGRDEPREMIYQKPNQPESSSADNEIIQDMINIGLETVEKMLANQNASQQPQPLALRQTDTATDAVQMSYPQTHYLSRDVVQDNVSPRDVDMEELPTERQGHEYPDLSFAMKEKRPSPKLREYQNELSLPGLKGYNYIICAPTGSGKTITAAHICHQRLLDSEREGNGDAFKAIFIVPTRHLKKQQRDVFQDLFAPGQATSLGEDESFCEAFMKGNLKVLMITAQVLVNAIAQRQFRLSDASMLVFDECHHTTLNHPYNEIMRQYLKDKREYVEREEAGRWCVGRPIGGLPQVIGLTASVGTGTSDDADSHIVTLCANLDSIGVKIVSQPENVQELGRHNKPPEQDQIIATPHKKETVTSSRITQILATVITEIEADILLMNHRDVLEGIVGAGCSSPKPDSLDYQSWIATIRSYAESRLPDLHVCADYLYHLNLAMMVYRELRAVDALAVMETFKVRTGDHLRNGRHCRSIYEKYLSEIKELAGIEDPLSNPKLRCLQELIKKVYGKYPDSKGIVLAQTRLATAALLDFIQKNEELIGFVPQIKPVRIVGQSKEVDAGQTQAKQEAALDHFKRDRANLLVATDIVQEGLNIPACNVIIRYNFVSNEIGTVQSKGRARAEDSKCFLIVESGSQNEAREHKNRERVIQMDAAIRRANDMKKEDWLRQIVARQLSIVKEIIKKEAEKVTRMADNQASSCRLLCKDCRRFICNASHLERRLSNYTCLDASIGERTKRSVSGGIREFRESRTVGVVRCLCGYALGQAIDFKRESLWKPGYNFTAKSFLFSYHNGQEERTYAKWKKVDFEIAAEQ